MRIFVNQKTAADSNYHSIEIDGVVVLEAGMSVKNAATWVGANYVRLLNYFSETRYSTKWAIHVPDVASVIVDLHRSVRKNDPTCDLVTVVSCHAGSDAVRNGRKPRNQDVYVSAPPSTGFDDPSRAVCDAVVKGMKRDVLCCKALRIAPANIDTILRSLTAGRGVYDEVETLEPASQSTAADSTETVIVEPVEVEHDGVVDVELAETSETIPVVETETAESETAELDSLSNDDLIKAIAPTFGATHGRVTTKPCTGKWRGSSDVRIMFDNGRILYVGVAATRKAKTKTMQRELLKEACALLSPGAVETRKRMAMRALRELEGKDAEIARAHGVEPYRVLAVELGQVESVLMCPYYVVLAIGDRIVTNGSLDEFSCFVEHDEWDRLATPASSFRVSRYSNKTSIDYVFHGIGFDADSYAVVSVPDEVIANARKVLADRETRVVESEPVLPAECDAVTQEIPEVPPQTNEDARVLQVSEHVIPACVTLKEYELTRNVPRKHCKQFRDARGRKCAYVVSADGGAFILWRDWYKHDDAELDAAVRAYYAQVA